MNNKQHLNNIKIIILLEWLELGGAERQAVILAHNLKMNHGAEVEVWGLTEHDNNHTPKNRLIAFCDELDIKWYIIEHKRPSDWLEWIDWLPKFSEKLKQAKPDVLMPFYIPNITAGIIWRRVGSKSCIWGQRDEGRYRPPRFIEHLAVANTPWFISNSKEGVNFLKLTLKINSARIVQIRNGVSVSKPQNSRNYWRDHLGLLENQVLIVMVANLHHYKDHYTLINAWKIIQDSLPDSKTKPILALAGYPYSTADTLKKQTENLMIIDSVVFLGQVDDIPGLLSAADICVHSSIHEGIPNGILEAMAMELPIVATNIPGIREAIGEDSIEWLAPPNDAVGLAERIMRLILDIKLRKLIGINNYQRVIAEFGVDRLGNETAAIILQAIQGSRPWSILGWIITAPGFIEIVLSGWQLLKMFLIKLKVLNRIARKSLSKTPVLWRLLK